MTNLDVVGGIPLVSAIGTPRTIGDTLGRRFQPRIKVLCQYLCEQLAGGARERGMDLKRLRAAVRPGLAAAARVEPAAWMEFESMAAAAEVAPEDLLIAHGHSDLFGFLGCAQPAMSSTFLAFAAAQTDEQVPLGALVAHIDAALLPYLTIVHRIPSHGPASLALTFCGLHPLLAVTEAGLGFAANELRVTDGVVGQITPHLLAATLNAPTLGDAVSRFQAGPRFGGRALHALAGDGERASVEVTGQLQAKLPDQRREAPRVHTNHPLADDVNASGVVVPPPASRSRLGRIASFATGAVSVKPDDIVNCFGVSPTKADESSAEFSPQSTMVLREQAGLYAPESVVFAVIDPRRKRLHLRRGWAPRPLEIARL